MPYTILSFVLILGGAVITAIVLIRRFPQIALLDVDKLPQEIQLQKKKQLLEEQYMRHLKIVGEKMKLWMIPLARGWKNMQTKFRSHVQKTYVKHAQTLAKKKKKPEGAAPPPEAVAALLKDAETQLLMENYDAAEQKFIEVVRFAPRTIEAYRGLGRMYFMKKQFAEARDTYQFILKLDPKDDRAYNRLGMIEMEQEHWKEAAQYYKRAIELDPNIALRHYDMGYLYERMGKTLYAMRAYERAIALEPMNPKYLDAYVKTAILLNNKEVAQTAYEQLKLANPDNKKLESIKRTIQEME